MMEPKPGETYRHYKRGGEYKIVCVAVIEATKEPCVVYEALYESAEHRFWVRPVSDFCASVENERGDLVSRFSLSS
jgi:hypothetical protein